MTAPSSPALAIICLKGSSAALLTIEIPVTSSSLRPLILSKVSIALSSATPPPATIPSSTAALVAAKASSTRSFSLSFRPL